MKNKVVLIAAICMVFLLLVFFFWLNSDPVPEPEPAPEPELDLEALAGAVLRPEEPVLYGSATIDAVEVERADSDALVLVFMQEGQIVFVENYYFHEDCWHGDYGNRVEITGEKIMFRLCGALHSICLYSGF